MKSDKGHRNRKDPASAEFFRKRRKEQNAERPKQDIITTVEHLEGAVPVVTYTRVRD